MEIEKPVAQHAWLKQLLGDWTFESESPMGPDQPPLKSTGTESVRALGELWVIGEGTGTMPNGAPVQMVLTIGFDPAKGRFVGSWIGSMMCRMWIYDGFLEGNKLTLESQGQSFTQPEKTALYRDAIEIVSPDHRVFTSAIQGDDGAWNTFMTAHYRRA